MRQIINARLRNSNAIASRSTGPSSIPLATLIANYDEDFEQPESGKLAGP